MQWPMLAVMLLAEGGRAGRQGRGEFRGAGGLPGKGCWVARGNSVLAAGAAGDPTTVQPQYISATQQAAGRRAASAAAGGAGSLTEGAGQVVRQVGQGALAGGLQAHARRRGAATRVERVRGARAGHAARFGAAVRTRALTCLPRPGRGSVGASAIPVVPSRPATSSALATATATPRQLASACTPAATHPPRPPMRAPPTCAWMVKARKATMARRPFLISLVCTSLKLPAGEGGNRPDRELLEGKTTDTPRGRRPPAAGKRAAARHGCHAADPQFEYTVMMVRRAEQPTRGAAGAARPGRAPAPPCRSAAGFRPSTWGGLADPPCSAPLRCAPLTLGEAQGVEGAAGVAHLGVGHLKRGGIIIVLIYCGCLDKMRRLEHTSQHRGRTFTVKNVDAFLAVHADAHGTPQSCKAGRPQPPGSSRGSEQPCQQQQQEQASDGCSAQPASHTHTETHLEVGVEGV